MKYKYRLPANMGVVTFFVLICLASTALATDPGSGAISRGNLSPTATTMHRSDPSIHDQQKPVILPERYEGFTVTRVHGHPVELLAGGDPGRVVLIGTNLDLITSAQVIQEGRIVSDITTRLHPGERSRVVYLMASNRTSLGEYQLRLVTENREIYNIPPSRLTIKVVPIQANGDGQTPTPPSSKKKYYDLRVKLTDLYIIDNCDRNSPGDWRIIVDAGTHGTDAGEGAIYPDGWQYWPDPNGSVNVDEGKTYHPDISFNIVGLPEDASFVVQMTGLDCDDDDTLWIGINTATTVITFFTYGLTAPISLAAAGAAGLKSAGEIIYDSCPGEELGVESSGHPDSLGISWIDIGPVFWTMVDNGEQTFFINGTEKNGCSNGSSPYKATFKISKSRSYEK